MEDVRCFVVSLPPGPANAERKKRKEVHHNFRDVEDNTLPLCRSARLALSLPLPASSLNPRGDEGCETTRADKAVRDPFSAG